MIEKKLITIIKKMTGSLICFGIDDIKFANAIKENNNIIYCDLLNSNYDSKDKKSGKKKYIKNMRKKYKKKKINYMIIKIEKADNYLKKLIRDSVYINNQKIYIYGNDFNYDIDLLIKKYNRYNVIIKNNKYQNGYIIEIDVTNAKNNVIKDTIYYIYDSFIHMIDKIGDIMS